MAIQFHCPSCRAVLSVGDEQANTKVLCPTCQQKLLVPTPPPPPAKKTVLGIIEAQPAPPPIVVSPPPPQEKVVELKRARREVELDDPELYSHRPRPEDRPVTDPAERLAQLGLLFGAIGLVIFGIPLGIVATVLAIVSMGMPNRNGSGTATGALVLGILDIVFGIVFLLFFLAASAPRH